MKECYRLPFSEPVFDLFVNHGFFLRVILALCVPVLGLSVPSVVRAQGIGLPAGWTSQDIGSPGVAGSTSVNNGTWTVSGSGSDIWGASDQFQFAYKSVGGDGSIVAYVASEGNTDPWAKSGVMFRSSTAANDLFAALVVTPGNGLILEWRKGTGSNFGLNQVLGVTAPVWIKLVRSGNYFTGFYSANGTDWTQAGSTQTVAVAAVATVGLCVDSHNNTNLNTSTFSGVAVTTAPPPTGWTDYDIGSPSAAGSAAYLSGIATWAISGGGGGINGTNDQFNLLSRPLDGDASIIAQIASQGYTGPGAQAGVMMRDSTNAASPFAYVGVTPSNSVAFTYRSVAGTNTSSIAAGGTVAAPIWVRLTRVSNNFSASFSYDGANWVLLGDAQKVSLGAIAQAGLAVSASNNAALSTAAFGNVGLLPPGWSDFDIGSPGVAGTAIFDGSNLKVTGGGANISGTSDQFNFAGQSYVGDVTAVAKVSSVTNGGANAKAGVMIRDGLGANASYAFMLLTPNGGSPSANFEYRNGAGSNSQSAASTTGISAPSWVKLVRVGNAFTAYYSADGVTWTQNGSSVVIPMSPTIQIGVAVDANDNASSSAAVFSNVSVTPAGWSDADIGSPNLTGGAQFDGLTWSVGGSGSNIKTNTDQFHFTSQSFAGDVVVVAQVGGLVIAGTNANAGVMIRDGAAVTANSSYAYMFFTPNNGSNATAAVFGYRNGTGATSVFAASTNGISAPNWVKLVRSGNSFSAYYSTDGVTWVQTGSSVSISMGQATQVGLAVSSNNSNILACATFANVSVARAWQIDLFLKQNGHDMRNGHGNGDVVPLRGVNVGTWLMYEPSFGAMDNSGLPDFWTVRNTLTARFGVAGRNRIEHAYQFNWITTADLDMMREWGMTCLRVPFSYLNLVETNGTWRADAFTHLDWIVNEAWKRGIYTIFDFHHLPGGGCPWASCGQIQNYGQFFSSDSNKQLGADIWSRIAAHFKGNPGIAAYDLMNEPNSAPDNGTLWNVYNWYFWVIRGADPDHTIQIEGNWDWYSLPNPSSYGWSNVAYQKHAYAFGPNGTYNPTTDQVDGQAWSAVQEYQHFQYYNIPDYIGEFAGSSDPNSFAYEHAVFNAYGMGWANWTWKADHGTNSPWADIVPYNWPGIPNLQTDSMANIIAAYSTQVTPGHYMANPLIRNTLAEPYAVADAYTTTQGQSLLINATSGVLSNDMNVNRYPMTAILSDNVSHGSLTLWSDGSFFYTPSPGYVGIDTFRYRASDQNSSSPNIITVSINVVAGTPASLPAGWTNSDIGSPGVSGTTTFNWSNSVWTVAGSGDDIWNNSDRFQYAYQVITGNGSVVARVTSIANTDPWDKAGVMIRDTLDSTSRHAMMAITSGNGAIFEWRQIANNSSSGSTSNGITAPYWVMVQRAGSLFTGYISSNGVSWTQVGSATIVMSNTVYFGMAVTAHNNSLVNAATMDNVGITPAPGAPSELTATAGDGRVSLAWTLSNGATSYNVKRAPFGGTFTVITNVSSTSYVDFNVTNGTTYYYIVTAVNLGGVSDNSNQVGATPIGYEQWANLYFFANPSQGATNVDADGTGQNNLFKYVADLDPTNPASVFRLAIQPVPPSVSTVGLTWMSLTFWPIAEGRTYTIEVCTNLSSGAYTPLTNGSSPQINGNQATVIDLDATQANKFYRVRISLP